MIITPPTRTITPADFAAATRLRAIWNAKKKKLGLTQSNVAEESGISQSAISQYLNGAIALNTDTILYFARILECAPTDIRPELGRALRIKPKKQRIFVTKSSTGLPIDAEIDASYINSDSEALYAVLIDEPTYAPRIKQGEYVIVAPYDSLVSGQEVLIESAFGGISVATFVRQTTEAYIVSDILNDGLSAIPLADIIVIHPIIAIQRTVIGE